MDLVRTKELPVLTLCVFSFQIGAKDDWTQMNLSRAKLHMVDPLATYFPKIRFLDLSGNQLESLEKQELHKLEHLEYVNISENNLPTLEHICKYLGRCHALKTLVLQGATRSDASNKPADNAKYCVVPFDNSPNVCLRRFVLARMRGLQSVDGITNPQPMTDLQVEAVQALREYDVGPNCCTYIDLTNKVRVFSLSACGCALTHGVAGSGRC